MKKRINLMAWLLAMLMSLGTLQVCAAETSNVLINEDFTTGGGQLIYTSNAGWLKTIEFDENENAYMVLTKKENVASQGIWEVGNISDTSSKSVVFEYDFNIMEQDSSFRCWLKTDSEVLSTTYVYKGTFMCGDYTKELDLNTWHRLSVVVDYEHSWGLFLTSPAIIYYLDGEKINTSALTSSQLSMDNKITSIRFNRADNIAGNTGVLSEAFQVGIDNVRFYEGTEPQENVAAVEKTIALTGTSIFDSDDEIAQGLEGYLAVHKRSGVVFANGVKAILPTAPTEDGEIVSKELATILGVALDSTTAETMKVETFMTDVLSKQVYTDDTTINSGMVIAGESVYPAPSDETELQKLNDYLFYYSPSASQLKSLYEAGAYANVHPRIQANASDFGRLREAYNNNTDAYITKWIDSLITEADSLLNKGTVTYGLTDGTRMASTGEKFQNRMYALGMAYQITGDEKYATRAYKELEAVSNFYDWNPYHTLDMSTFAVGVAIGYDWMYDAFTTEERAVIEKGVYNNAYYDAVLLYQGQMSSMRANTYSTENWNGVINGGYAMLTLAMADVYPDISFMLLQHNIRAFQEMLGGFAPAGAWHEGPDYWRYLMEYFTKGLDAIESVLGTDFAISKAEGLSTAGQYMIHMHGTQGIFTYGDGASNKEIYYTPLMWLSNKYEQPWLTTALLKNTDGEFSDKIETAVALLWYDPDMEEADLALERDAYYTGDEVVAMRSSFVGDDYTYAAFHAGDNTASHGHLDAGSFVFESGGIRWITELGKGDYNQTGYFDVSGGGRWKIYRTRAEGHSTLVINPKEEYDQDPLSLSKVIKMESQDQGVIMCADLTDAYDEFNASSVLRGMQFVDNRQSLVLRDEVTLLEKEGGNDVYWFLLTETEVVSSEVAADGLSGNVTLRSGEKTMRIDYVTTQPATLSYEVAGPIYDATQNLDSETATQIALKFTGITGDLAITAKFTPDTVTEGSDVTDYAKSMLEWEIGEPTETPTPTPIPAPAIPVDRGSYVFCETFVDDTYESGLTFAGSGWNKTIVDGYILCEKSAAKQAYFDVVPSTISNGTVAVYQTDFYLEDIDSPFRVMLFMDAIGTSSTFDVVNIYSGNLVYGEYTESLEANTWYTLSVVFDYENGKAYYYLNDICLGVKEDATNISMDSQLIKVRVNYADKINGISGNLEKNFKVRYDNVKIYEDFEAVETPAPTEAPTATPAPTEAPTATPTAVPTEKPTEVPESIPNIPTTHGTELFVETFDSEETCQLSTTTHTGCTATFTDGYLLYEKVVDINKKYERALAIANTTSEETAAMLRVKFYLEDGDTGLRMPIYFGDSYVTMRILGGELWCNKVDTAKVALTEATWHTLTVLADYTANTAYFYLDGVYFAQWTDSMISQDGQFSSVKLNRNTNDGVCAIRFDEISVYGVTLAETPTPAPTATPTPAPTATPIPKYTVTWVNIDGTVLEVDENVEAGTVPTYDGVEPSMTSDTATLTYRGWDKAITAVTGDVTYTATYRIDGIYGGYYYVGGFVQKNKGLIEYNGEYYFVMYSGKLKAGGNQTITASNSNGLVDPGTYYFFENGKMQNPADDLTGYIYEDADGELWYYVKGEVRKDIGLVEIDGCWYYVQYSGKVKRSRADSVRVNQTVTAGKLNNYTGEAGIYTFYSDGIMYDPLATEDGEIVDVNGVLYYYVDKHIRKDAGLVRLYDENGEAYYIFVQYSGKLRISGYQTIKEKFCNGHTEYIGLRKFVDGKMVK